MSSGFRIQPIPNSRIATFDVFAVGLKKHHVSALLEIDVTDSREKLRKLRRSGQNISLNAWLIKCICATVEMHPEAAAFKVSKRKLMIFDDVNVSFMVEKENQGRKIPLPLLVEKANHKSISELTAEIESAKGENAEADTIVLNKSTLWYEQLYYKLPGFIRRSTWKLMLSIPRFTYRKMGNVVITSLGMIGSLNGWFIHRSVHPLSVGIGAVVKKPVVIDKEVKIREILNMTVLIDHDVLDGAPMVRFVKDLTKIIEEGQMLN